MVLSLKKSFFHFDIKFKIEIKPILFLLILLSSINFLEASNKQILFFFAYSLICLKLVSPIDLRIFIILQRLNHLYFANIQIRQAFFYLSSLIKLGTSNNSIR